MNPKKAEIKPFHKLTKAEFEEIRKEGITWEDFCKECEYSNKIGGS